jgi:hypothetical protein
MDSNIKNKLKEIYYNLTTGNLRKLMILNISHLLKLKNNIHLILSELTINLQG